MVSKTNFGLFKYNLVGPNEVGFHDPKLKGDQFKFQKLHDVYETKLHSLMQLLPCLHSGGGINVWILTDGG